MAKKAQSKVKPPSNTYRIETEKHEGQDFPTLVIFVKKATQGDLERFEQENPKLSVERQQLDKVGCIFKLNTKVPAPMEMATAAVLSVRAPGDASAGRVRLNLTLSPSESQKLELEAQKLGITPTSMARALVRRGLGVTA